MLQQLEYLGVDNIITFDVHDPNVQNAIPCSSFENFYPTNTILKNLINDVKIEDLKNIVFVAPDNGAVGRRNVYLNSFQSSNINREAGSFYKQRDYNNLVGGKYPVISHDYCGNEDLEGKTAIISDDMIASGGSMFDVIDELKKRKVKKIFIVVTYALFTKGIEEFDKYYKNNMFDGIYTTNLSYIPKEYAEKEWLHICDCSQTLAQIIYNIHNDLSISNILRDKSEPVKLIEKKFETEIND